MRWSNIFSCTSIASAAFGAAAWQVLGRSLLALGVFACGGEPTSPETGGAIVGLSGGGGAGVGAIGVSQPEPGVAPPIGLSPAVGMGSASPGTGSGVGGAGSCGAGQGLCGGVCTDLAASATNCGVCGVACGTGEACVNGACVCAVGNLDCGGICVTALSDPNNCGGCGAVCGPADVCSNGACTNTCGVGFTTCDRACIDTGVDADNCGGCAVSCPRNQQCALGSCIPNCSQTLCGTSCVSILDDSSHCGGCGLACGSGQLCADGVCTEAPMVEGCDAAGSCPADFDCPLGGQDCGCYTVPGLGANKRLLLDLSADPYMIASAMIETELIDASTYALGDGKTNDSFNAGVCKQNWFMVRSCHPAWNGLARGDYLTSAGMNDDLALDVQVYAECRAFYGANWWAGHRNGSSGINDPNTQDIQNFKAAMDWTYNMLQVGGHFCDDVRFWVTVPAI